MGKGGGGTTVVDNTSAAAERLANIQGDIAQGLFDQSSPLRAGAFNLAAGDVGAIPGTRAKALSPLQFNPLAPVTVNDITANPSFGAQKSFVEQQFGNARQQALANVPRGGALQDVLGQLESSRARELSSRFGALAQDEVARRERERTGALTVAQQNRTAFERDLDRRLQEINLLSTGQTGQALSGLSAATGGLASVGATQAQLANAAANRDAGKSGGLGQAVGTLGAAAIKK